MEKYKYKTDARQDDFILQYKNIFAISTSTMQGEILYVA